ncbi:MAG: uracil-DNA glycosylase [Bacilli bacterium]|nr:uracil-DNA glycosylase [Bacilli bacterium]
MNNWNTLFTQTKSKDYSKSLHTFLNEEYQTQTIYPPRKDMFKAFELTAPQDIKMVIIGQDPYHEPGQAMGLSFSVPSGEILPPSLRNIYKELDDDLGTHMRNDGDLTYLAKQGVLLLNAYLTVRQGQPLSHHIDEYDLFMKDVIEYINTLDQSIVFMLWGGFAKKYRKYLTNPKFFIIESVHPSPLSANRGGWFGNHNFSKANDFLVKQGLKPIDWQN